MAKLKHSKRSFAETGWSDEVQTERQDNKNTVKDLIHLYDKKDTKGTPTQDQGTTSGVQSADPYRQGNYYSEEPRATRHAAVRRQHSQPKHIKQHSYSGHHESRRNKPSWTSGVTPGSESYADVSQKTNSLASKSWATPDDGTKSYVVAETSQTHEQRDNASRISSAKQYPHDYTFRENRISTQDQTAQQYHAREQHLLVSTAKDNQFQQKSSSQRKSLEDNHTQDTRFNSQDTRHSYGSRSRPLVKTSTDKPPAHTSQPIHSQSSNILHQEPRSRSRVQNTRDNSSTHSAQPIHRVANARTRSQSPRMTFSDRLSAPIRPDSSSSQFKGDNRTSRSSSTPRPIQQHRESPSEDVSRSQKNKHSTPPQVQYNNTQTFRSRSQSPQVSRNRDKLLYQPTTQPLHSNKGVIPGDEIGRSRRNYHQQDEQMGSYSNLSIQSFMRHSKQDSNISNSSQSTVNKGSTERVTEFERSDNRKYHNQITNTSSVNRERKMKLKSERTQNTDTLSKSSSDTHIHPQKVISHDDRKMLQRKPPVQMRRESQLQHQDDNLNTGKKDRTRHRQGDFNGNTAVIPKSVNGTPEAIGKSLRVQPQDDVRHFPNNQMNIFKESARSHTDAKRNTDQQREYLQSSQENYILQRTGNQKNVSQRMSYGQTGLETSKHESSPAHKSQEKLFTSPETSPSNLETGSYQGRGSNTPSPSNRNYQQRTKANQTVPSPTYRESTVNPQHRIISDHSKTSPTHRDSQVNHQQRIRSDHNTPSPKHRDSPINLQHRIRSNSNTPSPTYRDSPVNYQHKLQTDQHTPSPTQRENAVNNQQRIRFDHNTPSPTHRENTVNHQQRVQYDHNTPSPTHRDSTVHHRQGMKTDQNTSPPTNDNSQCSQQQTAIHYHQGPAPTERRLSSREMQEQRDSPQSNASLITDEYFSHRSVAQNSTFSQNPGSNTKASQQRISPFAYIGDEDGESNSSGVFIQTYSIAKPPPKDDGSDLSDIDGNFIQTYSLTKPYPKVGHSDDTHNTGDFVQTYSLSKPPQEDQGTHVETYTLSGQDQTKSFVETCSLTKGPEGAKLSQTTKALLGRSRDKEHPRKLQRSKSADVEKVLSGPREKWNIDPPPPCGTVRHIRQMSDEPLTDPTYSYVRTGQIASSQVYPGEGIYSEPQVPQVKPQHTRHTSYDGFLGTSTVPTRPQSSSQDLHYMSSPLFHPNYEEIPDNEVNASEKPLGSSERIIFQEADRDADASQGEIVMSDQDNVSYLEPVSIRPKSIHTKSRAEHFGDRHKPYHGDETVTYRLQDRMSTEPTSPSARPFEDKGKGHEQRHNQSNIVHHSKKSPDRLSVPQPETPGSSSQSDGSRNSPDSVKRSYMATMIGSKSTIRQVTLLESSPSQNVNYSRGSSEGDISLTNNFTSDISGLPESIEPSNVFSEVDTHSKPILFYSRQFKESCNRSMSLHSASSVPDLQELGNQLRKSNEHLHLLTKSQENMKTDMDKSFELLYKQTSKKDNACDRKVKKHYHDITIHRVFKHVAHSVPAFSMSWRKLLCELFDSYPSWFVQWVEKQITKENRTEKECIHECLVQWKDFQESMSDGELMVKLQRVLENVQLGSIAVGVGKILAKDKHSREQCIVQLDDRLLTSLAQEIGNEWKSLGVFLGFTYKEMERLELNHHRNIGAAIQEMMIAWRNKHGPSVQMLVKGFAKVKRMDLVDRLRPIFISWDSVN